MRCCEPEATPQTFIGRALKYLLIIPALGPVYGGPSKIAPAFAAALARQGATVDLVTTEANGPENLQVPVDRWIPQENGAWRLRYFHRHGRNELKLSVPMFRWLWAHVADYDFVHHLSIFNPSALATALICRARRVRYLVNPQGMLEPWALRYKSWKKQLYFRAVERPLVLRGACAIHALNGREAANLAALNLGPPVVTIPNGFESNEVDGIGAADAEKFVAHFRLPRDRRLILFLHRVDPKKGLDLLAAAFARVRPRFPDTHIVVAGPDNVGFAAAARGFFAAAGVGDDVTFTGMLEGEIKRGALAAASVFVAPSYSEGFSMSVLEAMAAGVPSVITEGCNFPEAAEAGAARVVPADAEAFAAALAAVLAAPAESKTMGEQGRKLVRDRYTWDCVAKQMVDACERLSRGPRSLLEGQGA